MTGHSDSIGQTGRVYTSPDGANTADEAIVLILDAICTGDLASLKANLKVPEHRSLRSPEGKTLLHAAAECGHPAIVAYLLESGWSVDAKMNYGETPLHLAARSRLNTGGFFDEPRSPWQPREEKHSGAIELCILQLIRQRGLAAPESFAAIDDLPKEASGPLYDAVLDLMSDRVRLHRELLAAGIPFDPHDPTFRTVSRSYPDYLKVAEMLIEHAAEINLMDESGHAPLHCSIESQSVQMVELLLSWNADPRLQLHSTFRYYPSPMSLAIEYTNTDAAALLHRRGVEVNFAEHCPMHQAAANGRLKILLWLLEIGGDINQRDGDGDTPLLCAALGHEEVITALCERKADCKVVNNKGQSVLHLSGCCIPALKRFLKCGLDINARDKTGLTPLHYAAQGLSDDAIPLLLSDGANVNAQDDNGNTSLHIIFFSEEFRPDIEFPTFKALVDGGADKTIKNKQGETPYDLAKKYRYPAEYLELLAIP